MDDKIEVRQHARRRPTKLGKERTEAEESFVAEFPVVAPDKGVKIVDARGGRDKATLRGVTRIGGGDHGKVDKGVKRLGY